MSEWIEELEENSKSGYNDWHSPGDLYNRASPYIIFEEHYPDKIEIDGIVTIEQLEALIDHMKKYKEKQC